MVLSLKSVGQAGRLETEAGVLCYNLEAEFLLLQETSVFEQVEPSTNWIRFTHIKEDNLFCLKSADGRCSHIYKVHS